MVIQTTPKTKIDRTDLFGNFIAYLTGIAVQPAVPAWHCVPPERLSTWAPGFFYAFQSNELRYSRFS